MAHQSLYRRYRPQRFSEVRGQDTVVGALRAAVAEDRVGHAYLFSGPRGTGKTSTARILAKALNCEDLQGGEPCGVCPSCVAMQAGTSYDLQELDAASNNKVEDVRALIERVALGSPGRTKVYILDEVHMLSAGASNALLKTLEEPPDHVVFVLATTDPQKVLPTIRSRTQHFEFHLLPADELADHVRWVIADAGLDVDDSAVEHVLRAGGGSARDTLSYLDQAAAGGVNVDGDHAEALAEAVVAVDTAAALSAVATATIAGRDPRILGEALLAHLRDVFLLRMGGPLGHLSDAARGRVEGWAGRTTDRSVTRALEEVGEALLAMRQAPDPRIPLEVALVRITRSAPAAGAGGDGGSEALEELAGRVARLEAAVRTGGGPDGTRGGAEASAGPSASSAPSPAAAASPPPAAPTPAPAPATAAPEPEPAAPLSTASAREAARAAIPQAAKRGGGSSSPRPGRAPAEAPPPPPRPAASRPPAAPPAAAPPPAAEPAAEPEAPTESPGAATPDAAPAVAAEAGPDLATLWADRVVPDELRGMTKALYKLGQVVGVDGDSVTIGLPNQAHLARCQEKKAEVEAAVAKAAGRPVRLVLVVGGDDDDGAGSSGGPGGSAPPGPAADESIDPAELVDAPAQQLTGVDRVTEAFPGAQIVEP
ncbi:DNA polymerase III subunit gamma/tau [Iamia sp. SCSIO 61187]|uniref:DNA polymerase III subunit gamma/tau n=1 Tax=Iamia sp. SCSIO 61187 TaxID=2722752 RepID=UPI001C637FFE|nr:DNA polymerase III subunit gamma/tau [Iamia sp. SCSIO 61187]QYG95016.1 DNA polymerase III subunit gamma/tau [Iamia sp. SCSIO 61187]